MLIQVQYDRFHCWRTAPCVWKEAPFQFAPEGLARCVQRTIWGKSNTYRLWPRGSRAPRAFPVLSGTGPESAHGPNALERKTGNKRSNSALLTRTAALFAGRTFARAPHSAGKHMATKTIDVPRHKSANKVNQRRIRKIFGNIHEISEMPNLIEVQRESYEQFLRSDPKTGYVSGLEKTLRSVFPIVDFAGTAHLDFDHYELEDPKYDTDECRQRGLTYAAPMRVTLRLTTFEIDPETEAKSVIDIKEQDVYMGDMPLMTMNGTFIINGTERVIVSQMHRSPGVLFDHDRGKTHSSGKYLFAARVIPYRGSWLDFEFDAKDIVNVRIDRKRKLPVTALLHALGMSSEEILNTFYNRVVYARGKNGWQIPYLPESWRGQKPNHEVIDADTGEVVFKANEKITPRRANQAGKDGVKNVLIPTEEIFGRFSAHDLINEKTGEIYIEAGGEVSPENMAKLDAAGVKKLELLEIDYVNTGPWIRNTLKADKSEDGDSALADIYRVMRPGEPPTRETA